MVRYLASTIAFEVCSRCTATLASAPHAVVKKGAAAPTVTFVCVPRCASLFTATKHVADACKHTFTHDREMWAKLVVLVEVKQSYVRDMFLCAIVKTFSLCCLTYSTFHDNQIRAATITRTSLRAFLLLGSMEKTS